MKQKMKSLYKKVLALTCSAAMLLGGILSDVGGMAAQAEEAKADTAHTLFLVGDSTVCAFNDNYYYPRYGYGTQIANYLADGTYTVENLALSGRSSKSFLAEGNYSKLKSRIKEGDIFVIGFGHNDEKAEADRYTNPNGDWQTEGSFAKSLYDNYVKIAEDAKAQVILCTPIVRRSTEATLSDSNCHITKDSTGSDGKLYPGGDYPAAVRKLGQDKNVPVVDLTALTKALYEQIGPDETLYLHAWSSGKPGSVDNTHLNIYGAKKVAWMFADAVSKLENCGLTAHISLAAGEPAREKDLIPNPDYKETPYNNNLKQSSLWEDYVIGEGESAVAFKGTVFGEMGGQSKISKANQTLEKDADGNMHIAVKGQGKIEASVDGIAMYYYKVPVEKAFNFSAKATVNTWTGDKQAAFGLMARDDMYIDADNKTIGNPVSSDYVAAGSLGTAGCNCFYRKNGELGGQAALTVESIAAGKSYDLSIVGNPDGYACTFGSEPSQSGGYDFRLNKIDSDYVYIGMFVARNADVTYSDIKLEIIEESPDENPGETPGENPSGSTTDGKDDNNNDNNNNNENNDGLKVKLTGGDVYPYTGSAVKPEVLVTNNGKKLTEGTDYTLKYSNNVNVSTGAADNKKPKITVTGKGNLAGSVSAAFNIAAKSIADADVVKGGIVVVNGAKAVPVLVYGSQKLGAKDFDISESPADGKYTENGTMKVKGKGNYTGEAVLNVTVVSDKSALKKFTVEVGKEALTYNGLPQTPQITVKNGAETLNPETDYAVVYPSEAARTNAGTVKFTVVGLNSYTGSLTKTFKINPVKASESEMAIKFDEPEGGFAYEPAGVTVDKDMLHWEVSYNKSATESLPLTAGRDYKVTYSNNKKVGTATVKLAFLGNYKGSRPASKTFAIKAAKLAEADYKIAVPDQVYTKEAFYKAVPIVTIGKVAEKNGSLDISYEYQDAEGKWQPMDARNKLDLGERLSTVARVVIKGKSGGNYDQASSISKEFTVSKLGDKQYDLSKAKITLAAKSYDYTGKEVEPAKADLTVTCKAGSGQMTLAPEQYDVIYMNNVNKGKATLMITGNGTADASGNSFRGSKSVTYTIAAQKMTDKVFSNVAAAGIDILDMLLQPLAE